MNFYVIIAVIVVLGLAAVVYSRYERQQSTSAATVWPQVGQQGFAALASQQCGTVLADFKSTQDSTGTYKIGANNVLQIQPTSAAQAGNNATLAMFINQTPGFSFTSQKMTFPGPLGTATAATTYVAGTKCGAGTKYAGQAAYPVIAYWTTIGQGRATLTTDPSSVKFEPSMLVTLAFEPKNVVPTRPSSTTIAAMLSTASTTTTVTTTTVR